MQPEHYQKQSHIQSILARPETYIGSDGSDGVHATIRELLYNACDHSEQFDVTSIWVTVEDGGNLITIKNNGPGIPCKIHPETKLLIPEMVFGHLLTSTNYDDEKDRTTGGRNGLGAKLANIYASSFIVETVRDGKKFVGKWENNMSKCVTRVTDTASKDYLLVKYRPDWAAFGLTGPPAEITDTIFRRAQECAGTTTKPVKVYFNKERIPIKTFKEYCKKFIGSPNYVYADLHKRWKVCVAESDSGDHGLDNTFEHRSFVNDISTNDGGTHLRYITNQIVNGCYQILEKKHKNYKFTKAFIMKHLRIFLSCRIVRASFTSQTKTCLRTTKKDFGSHVVIPESFMMAIIKKGIFDRAMRQSKHNESKSLMATDGKRSRRVIVNKLDDANNAGKRTRSQLCTLILTEGDSAKALAMAGLSTIGRDNYGVFPLRGKPINARDASAKQLLDNAEFANLKKIIGLRQGEEYTDTDKLRYDRVMIMCDADHDGSHIKGLIINLFHKYWPSLIKIDGFLCEFVTPIVVAYKNSRVVKFYTLPEYDKWKVANNVDKWHVKYFKGLATSTSKDAKVYFSDMDRHSVDINYRDEQDDEAVVLAFDKKKADARKQWISKAEPDTFLNTNVESVGIKEFIDKELVLYSIASNTRAIPSVTDGMKPSHRKVLYTMLTKPAKESEKVATLSGRITSETGYHHGEVSLHSTITLMAQKFQGSNNIPLLAAKGQFGTRALGGKDAGAARYIFTALNKFTPLIFPKVDLQFIPYNVSDGVKVEPTNMVPIIPMVLVNGADGIGTGWSTKIPCFNYRDIVANLVRTMDGKEYKMMTPWYRGFTGTIEEIGNNISSESSSSNTNSESSNNTNTKPKPKKFLVRGNVVVASSTTIAITELQIGLWTSSFKSFLDSLVLGGKIISYYNKCTEYEIDILVNVTPTHMNIIEQKGLHKFFKLESKIMYSNMTLFGVDGKIKRYKTVKDIFTEYYTYRLDLYKQRKVWLIGEINSKVKFLAERIRFIKAVLDEKIVVHNKTKAKLVESMKRNGFEPETYDRFLGMSLWSLTVEKVQKDNDAMDELVIQWSKIKAITEKDMWKNDLRELMVSLKKDDDEFAEEIIAVREDAEKAAKRSTKNVPKRSTKNVSKRSRGGMPKLNKLGIFKKLKTK